MEISVAVVVLAALGFQLSKPDFALPRPQADRMAPVAGALAGVLHGAASMFLLYSLIQSIALFWSGLGSGMAVLYGLISLPITPIGMVAGRFLAGRLSDRVFRIALLLTVGASCLAILLR